MKRLKKYLSIVLVLTMFLSCFTSVFAAQNMDYRYLTGILKQADEVKVVENGERMSIAYAIMQGKKIQVEWDRNTNDVILKESNVSSSRFKRSISEQKEVTFRIDFDNELQPHYNIPNYENNRQKRSIALPIILGEELVRYLISIAVTIKVGNDIYTLAEEVISKLNRDRYEHYYATLGKHKLGINLFIGPAFENTSEASAWLRKGDVWSKSENGAKKVASGASFGTAVGPECSECTSMKVAMGFGYFNHFHTVDRLGGHSFFGPPVY